MRTVFIVDDNNTNLYAAQKALSSTYKVFTLPSAAAMFELLENVMPDLILLDVKMPEIDGFEAMRLLKENKKYKDIPVIFLTSQIDADTEVRGFEMGAVDFIPKPFSELVLLNHIKSHMEIEELIHDRTEKLQQRTEKLQKLQNSMVSVLANMIDNRDKLTGKHIERTTKYVKILLDAMMERGIYEDEIKHWDFDVVDTSIGIHDISEAIVENSTDQIMNVAVSSSRLHDIGKIVITDLILNKPGNLTDEEFEIIKTHTIEGEKIIDTIMEESGHEAFLQHAKLYAGSHHESWNGKGYPRGLKGEEIPLQGRIMALADVYDALLSDRPYKKAFTHEKAVEIIKESRGSHFDPKIVDVFLEINEMFAEISSHQR